MLGDVEPEVTLVAVIAGVTLLAAVGLGRARARVVAASPAPDQCPAEVGGPHRVLEPCRRGTPG